MSTSYLRRMVVDKVFILLEKEKNTEWILGGMHKSGKRLNNMNINYNIVNFTGLQSSTSYMLILLICLLILFVHDQQAQQLYNLYRIHNLNTPFQHSPTLAKITTM